MFSYTDLKSIFAKASGTSTSSPAPTLEVVAERQEEPAHQENVRIEVSASVQEEENEGENYIENEPIARDGGEGKFIEELHPDHIQPDPGLRIPINNFHPNIRDEVRLAYVAKGPTRPVGHAYERDHFDRAFCEAWYEKKILGWNIAWKRMQSIAFIVFFSDKIRWMKNLVILPSPKMATVLGRMHTRHFLFMLVAPGVSTINQGQHMKILKIKAQV